MNNMIELAKQQVKETVMNALGRLVAEGKIEAVPLPAFNVERPADVSHGDFSCNAAMASAKALRNNPRAIGQMIADAAVLDGTVFDKIEVAGPGFLNFFISPLWFNETVGEVISSGSDYGKTELGKGKRVLVEFVSANPTGPMHIGNARGGALGDSLSSVLQFAGYEVEREFYVNDAGNQIEKFGKSLSIRYMQIADGNKADVIASYGDEDVCRKIFEDEENFPMPEDVYKGVDIIAQHQDTTAPQVAAEEKGAYCIGYNFPTSDAAPKAYLTAACFDWKTFYTDDVKKAMDGTWTSRAYWEGLAANMTYLDKLTDLCAEGTQEKVDAAKKAIIDGTLEPFTGPLYDQEGNKKVEDGVKMTDDEIWNMNWFVKGVTGTIPA